MTHISVPLPSTLRRLSARRGQALLARAIVAIGIAAVASTITTDNAVDLWRIQDASRRTVEGPSSLRQAVAAIASRHSDRDGDGIVDAPAMDMTGATMPQGGGVVPAGIGAPAIDPWGTRLGYCAWKLGPGSLPAGMLQGPATSSGSETSFVVISAGADRSFQTSCASALAGTVLGDDRMSAYSLADVALASAGVGGTQAVSASTAVQAQQAVCAAKGKLFAGTTVAGADADGCMAPVGSNGGIVTDEQGHLAVSCKHVSQLVGNPADGEYLLLGIPADGSLPLTYVTRCDFGFNGGKWTLAAKYDPSAACPSGMKPGAACTTPAAGIDLFDYSRITTDLASPRANTGSVRFMKPWREMLFKDSGGGWTTWDCGGAIPAAASFGQQFVEAQTQWSPVAACTMTGSSREVTQNALVPRFRVNLTGFRHMTSIAWMYNTCLPMQSCWWDATARTATIRDPNGFNGSYYFTTDPWGMASFPAIGAAGGVADVNNRVCPDAPVGAQDMLLPFGGTLTNGCRAGWTQSFRGPWALNAGPYRAYDYSTDYPGDLANRIPLLAHLGPQPRPDEIWAPKFMLRIVAASGGNLNSTHNQYWSDGKGLIDTNDRCFFGYPDLGNLQAYTGAGIFFAPIPNTNDSSIIYGSGNLDATSFGFGGEWQEPYGTYYFSGGIGMKEAMVGPIAVKSAMVPGSAGQTLCVRNKRMREGFESGGCIFSGWRDLHHYMSFGGAWFNPCSNFFWTNKVEIPFGQMPANVPLGLVRSYLPVDIREIWLR